MTDLAYIALAAAGLVAVWLFSRHEQRRQARELERLAELDRRLSDELGGPPT